MLSTLKVATWTPGFFVAAATRRNSTASATAATEEEEMRRQRRRRIERAQQTFLKGCSYGGVGMASLLSANAGKRAGMSPFGATLLGFVGGMGGGTMRDVFQGKRAFWLEKPQFAWWSLCTSLAGFYAWDGAKRVLGVSERDRWAQAVSLASLGGCVCSGAQAALAQGGAGVFAQPIRGAVYASLCAVGGGIVRDVLLARPRPATLYPEGWAMVFPAAAGTVAYQAAHACKLPPPFVAATAFSSAIALRLWLTKRYARQQQQQQKK